MIEIKEDENQDEMAKRFNEWIFKKYPSIPELARNITNDEKLVSRISTSLFNSKRTKSLPKITILKLLLERFSDFDLYFIITGRLREELIDKRSERYKVEIEILQKKIEELTRENLSLIGGRAEYIFNKKK